MIGEEQWLSCKDRAKRQMLLDFESLKRSFDPADTSEHPIGLTGIEDDPELGIQDDTIIVKR